VGGGFLIVPALVAVAGLSMPRAAAAGALAGGAIAPRLPQRILQQAFAAALVILGSYVLFRA